MSTKINSKNLRKFITNPSLLHSSIYCSPTGKKNPPGVFVFECVQQGVTMSGIMRFITGRRRMRSSTSDASASSSRRHSVSESPRSMEEDNPAPRSDMLLLGGMRDPRSSSMRFNEGMSPPPRRSTRSSAPPPYKPKNSEYGFIILSKEEEERLRGNYDFDDEDLGFPEAI